MQGINFVVDDHNEKIAVIIDLSKYRELWEDFYDHLVVSERQHEPRESLAEVRQQLIQQGKLTVHD
jgi:PHD/YefM family antitoxin component YafN of YafNO toxin-antitoxin module